MLRWVSKAERERIERLEEDAIVSRLGFEALLDGYYSREQFNNDTQGVTAAVGSFAGLFRDRAFNAYVEHAMETATPRERPKR